MKQRLEPLETLTEIRSLMERSSRFISLSGLSGVFAGVFALLGAAAAYYRLGLSLSSPNYYRYAQDPAGNPDPDFYRFFVVTALLVLGASLVVCFLLTYRKARRLGLPLWDATARRLAANLLLPLVVGGLFCLALLYHGQVGLVAPATLLFYGLALLNASKYTLRDLRYLAICEMALGLLAAFFIGYGLLFWAFGFGVLHIVYGVVMYQKYDR